MKRHTAASILHPEALVQLFVQVYDIIQYIRENKNTLLTAGNLSYNVQVHTGVATTSGNNFFRGKHGKRTCLTERQW